MEIDAILERWSSQARKGYLEMALLRRLSSGRTYGYQLIAGLKPVSGFENLAEGTVYPVLARLRSDGLVNAEWIAEDGGAPRKYYEITSQGEAALKRMTDIWTRMTEALQTL